MIKSIIVRTIEAVISIKTHGKPNKSAEESKCLLLPLFGMIGDGVMFLDALNGYLSFFHDEQGYKIIIACRKQMGDLIRMVYPDREYEIIEMDRNRMRQSLNEFSACLSRLKKYNYDLILNVRERLSDENVLIYALCARRKITFRASNTVPNNIIAKFFYKHTYDEVIYADRDSDQYKRYGKPLKELGYSDYISHVSRIPMRSERVDHSIPYIVISPGASDEKKCWPPDRFADLCARIIERYSFDICISGSETDRKYAKIIKQSVPDTERIQDYCGSTSMSEWIELIRDAELVISNDSASVHVAASVQTPSVCIAPQHDGYRFLPYQPDEVLPDDTLPYPVRCAKVECFDCRLNNRKNEIYGNPECKRSIKEKKTMKCIDQISVDNVMQAVEVAIKNNRI